MDVIRCLRGMVSFPTVGNGYNSPPAADLVLKQRQKRFVEMIVWLQLPDAAFSFGVLT
jgi:hypothetical protein